MNIEKFFKEKRLPDYRFNQFLQGYFKNHYTSIDQFTNFPIILRQELSSLNILPILTIIKENKGVQSTKVLFKTKEKLFVETVLIKEDKHNTVCVSCQSGCPVGCIFCSTGSMGFKGDLTKWEIIEQVMYFERILSQKNQRVDNIVYMGMGEPLLNLDEVLSSIDLICSKEGLNISERNITVSTSGILKNLPLLLSKKNQFKIAFSIHAGNQKLREKLIPSAKNNNLNELLKMFKEYSLKFNKRISYEYVLLNNINDSTENALELARILEGQQRLSFINLIMYNKTENTKSPVELRPTSKNKAYAFSNVLSKKGFSSFIRFSEGQDINGACGQLAYNN